MNQNLIKTYFERKIKNYRSQDSDANRTINTNNYVNADWLIKNVNNRCVSCNCDFYISFDTGNSGSNITADRIDSSKDHNLDNIQPMCRYCNNSKSDKILT